MRRLALLLLCLLMTSCDTTPVDPGSALGESGSDETLWRAPDAFLTRKDAMRPAFELVRNVLWGDPAPDGGALADLPGRRVFVCAYPGKPRSICTTGVGKNLLESLRAAANALKEEGGSKVAADRRAEVRLKIDVVTRVSDATFNRDTEKPKKEDIAAYGYWVQTDNGQVSWLLPSEMLELALYNDAKAVKGVPRKNAVKELKRRNGDLGELPEEFPYRKLRTIAWAEKDGDAPRDIFRMLRLHPYDFEQLSPDGLLQRMVWAGDYLISSTSADGKIRYNYRVARDDDSRSYNLLRHGGTTYSLLQLYDRTRYEPYKAASEKAFDYLFARCDRDNRTGPKGPFGKDAGEVMYVVSPDGLVKLGGVGLALLAIDQYVEATGDTERYRDQAMAFGRFLVASIKEDGEFLYFPPRNPGGPLTSTDDSAYYPGEAILGLIRLYSWDKNPLWLQTAVDASNWLIDVRDKGKDERKLENDHWLMLALSYVYHYTNDDKYKDHSLALARAVEYQYERNRDRWEDNPDYQGGYYNPPRSTPAGTRGEGLGAVLDTCRVAGIECGWVRHLLEETARHEILSQYDPDMTFWMKDRARAFGGWNGGITDTEVRNDYVQHNMSSIIGLERHWRAELGEVLPGGPGWMEKRLAGAAWSGEPAARMATLQEATRRFRGPSHWEDAAAPDAKNVGEDAPEGEDQDGGD